MHKCIYCLEEKEDRFFNKEHVVPRMMGTYNNGLVLSHKQVCESCNSFFRDELENKLDLDSFEAWLRMQYRTKPLANGTILRKQRITVNDIKLAIDECKNDGFNTFFIFLHLKLPISVRSISMLWMEKNLRDSAHDF